MTTAPTDHTDSVRRMRDRTGTECAAEGLPLKLSDYGQPAPRHAVPDDGSYPDGAPVAEQEGTQQ